VEIELIFVAGCPHSGLARERLGSALSAIGRTDVAVRERVVADQHDAIGLRMAGSPTILIDGRDPFAPGGESSFSCRLYRGGGGRLEGAPSVEDLIKVLRP
jgi:hypothetical protein